MAYESIQLNVHTSRMHADDIFGGFRGYGQ